MPKYTAHRDSYGFRGRYWTEGDHVIVTSKEVKESEELKNHFAPYKTEEEKEAEELAELQADEEEKASDDLASLTNNQLKEKLTAAGIEIPRNPNKEQLIQLLTGKA